MSSPIPANAASSGIVTDNNTGERHIPASKRPDGSTRREIRIRPGYRPPEDVEVYKNRTAEAWKTRGSGGVPGAETLTEGGKAAAAAASASSTKNAKRREARKRAKAAEAEGDGAGTEDNDGEDDVEAAQARKTNTEPAGADATAKDNEAKPVDIRDAEQIERDKKARKLRKKLREARELQEKKEKGEGLLQEQFEKVIKINELIRDLDKLGIDSNGESKRGVQAEEAGVTEG